MKDDDSGRPRFPPVNAFSHDMWCLVTDHRTIQLTSSPTYTHKKKATVTQWSCHTTKQKHASPALSSTGMLPCTRMASYGMSLMETLDVI